MDPVTVSVAGVTVTPLRRIRVPGGDVFHALKACEADYNGFGEAYFSAIDPGQTKPWRRHDIMTLNLVVPIGAVRFVIHDDRQHSDTRGRFQEVLLSASSAYSRLHVAPGLWLAFQGLAPGPNLILNIADFAHQPDESQRRGLDAFPYPW